REEKLAWLAQLGTLSGVDWQALTPDELHNWFANENADEFARFLPIASKATKAAKGPGGQTIFKLFSVGVKTNRDEIVYGSSRATLAERIKQLVEDFNAEVDRYKRSGGKADLDDFVRYDKIKWSESLKANVGRGRSAQFCESQLRTALYRPFCKRELCFNE